ncbi:MAG TPA: hypothetical protein PK286_07525, partial [Devosia sp.]|nr:hypothetical protein [Devosia sp.]
MKRANEKAGPVRRESAPDGTRVVNASPDDWAWYGEERRVYPRNSAVNDADDFAAVLEHRNRPDHPYEPLQSNWSTTPEGVVEYEMTGEGKRDAVRPAQDLHLEVTPSIEEILRAMAGDWVWKQEPVDPAEPKMPRGELV